MNKISAILLAAGESRRMGEINKLTLDINGSTLLKCSVEILLSTKLQELVVVLGYEIEKSLLSLEGLKTIVVINDDYQQGQMSSVYKGLNGLKKNYDGVMICLSDQPLLRAEDVDFLINNFDVNHKKSILIPSYKGNRGNPIILKHSHIDDILNKSINLGCRYFINKNPELVKTIEMQTNHVVFDLDTPKDYLKFTSSRL